MQRKRLLGIALVPLSVIVLLSFCKGADSFLNKEWVMPEKDNFQTERTSEENKIDEVITTTPEVTQEQVKGMDTGISQQPQNNIDIQESSVIVSPTNSGSLSITNTIVPTTVRCTTQERDSLQKDLADLEILIAEEEKANQEFYELCLASVNRSYNYLSCYDPCMANGGWRINGGATCINKCAPILNEEKNKCYSDYSKSSNPHVKQISIYNNDRNGINQKLERCLANS